MPPRLDPATIYLVVDGSIARAEAAALCDRVRTALDDGRARMVICDVGAVTDADLDTIDALARVQLIARQVGCQVRLQRASNELRQLLALVGLRDVVQCGPRSDLEAGRKAEGREETRGVEEEGDPVDPPG